RGRRQAGVRAEPLLCAHGLGRRGAGAVPRAGDRVPGVLAVDGESARAGDGDGAAHRGARATHGAAGDLPLRAAGGHGAVAGRLMKGRSNSSKKTRASTMVSGVTTMIATSVVRSADQPSRCDRYPIRCVRSISWVR